MTDCIVKRIAVYLILATSFFGCVNLEPPADPTRYYLLNGAGDPASIVHDPTNEGPVVRLAPVDLDPYLDTPYMVTRLQQHEVQFSDVNRWGEDLSQNIRRALKIDLMASGAASDVVTESSHSDADFVVRVHVHRFEGVPPDVAHLSASWELSDSEGNLIFSTLHDNRNAGWSFNNFGHLAEKLDEALMQLAGSIAERIPQ